MEKSEKEKENKTLFNISRFLMVLGSFMFGAGIYFSIKYAFIVILGFMLVIMGLMGLIRHNRLSVTIELKNIGKK